MSETEAAYLSHPEGPEILAAASKIMADLLKSASIAKEYKVGSQLVFSIGFAVDPIPFSAGYPPEFRRFACSAYLNLNYWCSKNGVGTYRENCCRRIDDSEFKMPARASGQNPAVLLPTQSVGNEQPLVLCLCGSTRFRTEIAEANRAATMAGKIVLAPGVFGHSGDPLTDEDKDRLDRLHFQKIDMADEVLVVNPGDYIGESTRREISYAERTGKPVRYTHSPL